MVGQATGKLLSYVGTAGAYLTPHAEIRDAQVAALDERLQEKGVNIKLVALRARDAGISRITRLEDVVPLLLPHTAYKSYPEGFLTEKKWDRLSRWLGTITPYQTGDIDVSGVNDIDGWLSACEKAGHMVSCTSGTTGKPAMLVASRVDLEFMGKENIFAVEWATDIRRGDKRTPAGAVSPIASTPRNRAAGGALMASFVDLDAPRFDPGLPPVTIGTLTRTILLRKAIAEGTALPEEISAFEKDAKAREEALLAAQTGAVEDIIGKRGQRLFILGMWASLHPLAEMVRARGYSAGDFHPENALMVAGGLKKARLPPDYREFVCETFNLHPRYTFYMYSMQELNTWMPRCRAGRYHMPPWLVCLPLDKDGEALVQGVGEGKVEGRAAFFDLSMDGRWGGVISGDHIEVDYDPCACGNGSPSIADNVYRYADLAGDDKIACAGTVDTYVRGLS